MTPKGYGWKSLVFLLVVIFGGLLSLDSLLAPRQDVGARPVSRDAPHVEATGRSGNHRMFVLLVDSLRYQSATSARLMPRFVGLQKTGTIAKVITTRDAVTVPALRAAFTGRDRIALFGFVQNFVKNEAGIESLFTAAKRDGLRAMAYSDGSFNQFGQDVERRSNVGVGASIVDAQNDALKHAVQDYRRGRYDVVVAHITYADHVAHGGGIGTDLYRATCQVVDEIIEKIADVIPADETFVVMGDHGHDEAGRHALGLDVPTFAFYRGASFCAGCDLGAMSITDHRYLMGWALGLSLPRDYRGGVHPEALAGLTLPGEYAQKEAPRVPEPQGLAPTQWTGAGAMILYLGALVILALLRWQKVQPASWLTSLALWGPLLPLALPMLLPWNALAGATAAIAAILWIDGPLQRKRRGRWILLSVAALAGLCLWGGLQAHWRATFHDPAFWKLGMVWAAIAVVALALAFLRRDPLIAWIVLGAPLVLFYPTVYRYGSVVAMGPAWMGWTVATAIRAGRRVSREALLAGGALLLILLPFKAGDGENFAFVDWLSWPITGAAAWMSLALVAKLVIFVRRGRGAVAVALGLAMVAFLLALERGWLLLGRWELAVALLCAVGAAVLARSSTARAPRERTYQRLLAMGALLIAYHATVRVPDVAFAWMDCLLAAIVLSAWFARATLEAEWIPAGRAVLTVIGLFAAGWVTLAWTVHWLEWGFLYGWFDVAFVERHVGWFIPVILVRYAIPVIVARMLLDDALGALAPYPRRAVWLMAGAKGVSLLVLTFGIGFYSATSEVFLEAAQETGIFAVLCAGLI